MDQDVKIKLTLIIKFLNVFENIDLKNYDHINHVYENIDLKKWLKIYLLISHLSQNCAFPLSLPHHHYPLNKFNAWTVPTEIPINYVGLIMSYFWTFSLVRFEPI